MTQKIKNLTGLLEDLRGKLREYLTSFNTRFSSNGQQFQCPNRQEHVNQDVNLSAGFPDSQKETIWNCFACGRKGDIFEAAALLEGKPRDGITWITDTVLYLADKMKVPYEFEELTPEEKRERDMLSAISDAAELAHRGFLASDIPQKYVEERGWSLELAKKFKLGYCDYSKLYDTLLSRGYSTDILEGAGLTSKVLLHQRLLFPIMDEYGKVRGFTARTLLPKKTAEEQNVRLYVNSDTNSIYKKSKALYNIHNLTGDTVMLVEGPADVLTLEKNGVFNAVALCGVVLTDEHFKLLTKKGITKVIFCLDNDLRGREAEEKILTQITRSHDISVYVKNRDSCVGDVDDCLKIHDYLLASGEKTMFEYYLERYKETQTREYRDKTLRAIFLERSRIDQDTLCKKAAKELDVRQEVIWDELNALIDKEGEVGLISQLDIIREKASFEQNLYSFKAATWSRTEELLGLPCGFPLFTQKMDGVQPAFYIIAGEEGTGKSSFCLNLASGLAKASPDRVFILYFAIDDTVDEVTARLMAMESELEINAMLNPKYKIQQNASLTAEQRERMLKRYNSAFESLCRMSSYFVVKDESAVSDIHDIERTINTFKAIADESGRQLVVFIDSLHRINNSKKFHKTVREAAMEVSNSLKRWRNVYKLPIIATAELRKLNDRTGARPTADDIKEASDFKYDVNVTLLLYSDLRARKEFADLIFRLPGVDAPYPVVELNVDKNKKSSFKGRMYFKFYPEYAKVEECTGEEQQYYYSIAFPAPKKDDKGKG